MSLLNLLINCISARSATKILSLNDEYTFRFSNYVVIGLCNSPAYSWFDMFLFLAEPPEANFFIKAFINH